MRRRTTSSKREAIARVATAAGITACLSFGVVFTADASPAQNTDPGLELLEEATDALGRGNAEAYDALVDEALSGDVWIPAAAINALIDRDVQSIVLWSEVFDLDDVDLLDNAAYGTLEAERDALAVLDTLPAGAETTSEQNDEITDADLNASGVLEVLDRRGIAIPGVVRNVLEQLDVTGGAIPTTPDYDAALDELDRLSEQLTTPIEQAPSREPTPDDATPTAVDAVPAAAPADNTTPSTAAATPTNDTAAAPQTVTAEVNAAGPSADTSPLPMIAVGVIAAASFALASYTMLRGRKSNQLADIAYTDGLTGLKNRRRLDIDVATQRERGDRATATLMIDVDHFKAFNDTHGHAMGDEVLRIVGEALRQEFRRTDVPYRYGGEEFCVLLNDVTPGEAVSAGERARAAIAAVALPIAEPVTVSIGVSIGAAEHLGDTIKRADAALYDAKAAGRDRVTFATS